MMVEEFPLRRKGRVIEYQNGRYFMYITEWDEVDERSRRHTEIEIYHVKTRLLMNSTDVKEFEKIKEKFFSNPESFEKVKF